MKAIFAVLFFGIMTYVSAQVSSSQCQSYSPMPNFDPSKFFLGSWFVTHAKNGPEFAVCRTYHTSVKGREINLNANGYYGDKKKNSYYKVSCTGPKGSGKLGKFSLSCNLHSLTNSPSPSQKSITYNLDLTIIKTDYSQYAIVYRCAWYPSERVTKDNLLILHRDKQALLPNIAQIFQQETRMPLSGLPFTRQKTTCKSTDNYITDESIDELLKF
uniref:Salivary lipocalin n=1 Tax=Triatoma dimidiata TaxID=72491 RepID=D1MWC4_TRIDM|nr:hypothetical protein Td19 similar to salivary lipocalin [Triatoma dimidiata]